LHSSGGYTNQKVWMASKVQEARTMTTPRVAPFLAGAVQVWLSSRTFDRCNTYIGRVVTMEKEGAQMFSSLRVSQAARAPLPAANRGYIR